MTIDFEQFAKEMQAILENANISAKEKMSTIRQARAELEDERDNIEKVADTLTDILEMLNPIFEEAQDKADQIESFLEGLDYYSYGGDDENEDY